MNIAFCDDDIILLEKLIPLVKLIVDKYNLYNFEFEYFSYSNPTQLINDHKKLIFDTVFLDIEMPSANGLNVGDEIFSVNRNVFIFYVTSFEKYLATLIKHRVYRFIKKEDQKELEEGIQSMLNDLATVNANYVYSVRKHNYVIPLTSIEYFESERNDVKIITTNKTYSQRITVKELLDILPSKLFCRCHSAYIVNIEKIREITNDYIILHNDKSIPISDTYRTEIFQRFMDTF